MDVVLGTIKVVVMGGRGVPDTARNFPARTYTVPCPIIHALNLIGGKWKLPVLSICSTRNPSVTMS